MFSSLRIVFWRWWYDSAVNRRLARPAAKLLGAVAFAYVPPKAAAHIPRHIRFMIKMDPIFGLRQAEWELLRQRNALREKGIGPRDKRYPDIAAVLRSWGEDENARFEKTLRVFRRLGYGT